MEKSRRTILLITPEYLKDGWPKLQLLTATHQMMEKKHGIIPVILRDINHVTDDIDPVLRNIMKSFTCIKWPQDDDPKKIKVFWEHLRLELPKKKKKKNNSDNVSKRNSSNNLHNLFRSMLGSGTFSSKPSNKRCQSLETQSTRL